MRLYSLHFNNVREDFVSTLRTLQTALYRFHVRATLLAELHCTTSSRASRSLFSMMAYLLLKNADKLFKLYVPSGEHDSDVSASELAFDLEGSCC